MENFRDTLQVFVRRYGLLNASCCDECCGQQVSLVQSHILYEVKRKDKPSMQEVAEELGIDITTFSRQIKTLETKGLIEKISDKEDRRVNLLYLTDEGEKVIDLIDAHMSKRLEVIFSHLSEFEKESVIRSIKLFNSALLKAGSCCSI